MTAFHADMRRFFILLLAVLLFAQFNWVAAASACTHEAGPANLHFGHHQHEHKGGTLKAGHNGGTLTDDDCPVCHLGCGTASPPMQPQLVAVASFAPAVAPLPLQLTAWSDPPERPRWQAAR